MALDLFLRSPLSRHPRLLGRKLASRLGLYGQDAPVPAPRVSEVVYPEHWARTLRLWTGSAQLAPGPHSFQQVFGQTFEKDLLLRLCREGPRPGAQGLLKDIKLAWDYSRGHALFTNAAGPEHLELCVAFVKRWLAANDDTNGRTWTCAMEVAIRAVNWIFADVLFEEALSGRMGRKDWAAWLWRHGWVVWRRLEARLVSSNHYLADLLGLCVIGSVFPEDTGARSWLRFARDEFPRALLAQTRGDGGLGEASLPYHAFVTEMALLFRLAQGAPFPPQAEARLRRMCAIVADFADATGDVFRIGDDDSGRVLGVDFASSLGRADILLRLAASLLGETFKPSNAAVCPESGWWVQRAGDFVAALDFGGVGLEGMGAHAHNDDLSLCLDWRGRTGLADPGTFLYTSDVEARNRFRSTLFHNTLAVDGREQRDLTQDVFQLPGPDAAFAATQLPDGSWAFDRPLAPGVSHRREPLVSGQRVVLRDRLQGTGRHHVDWRFHLHPGVQPRTTAHGFKLSVPGTGTLLLEARGAQLSLEILPSEYSPGYGRRQETRSCAASGDLELPASVEWVVVSSP